MSTAADTICELCPEGFTTAGGTDFVGVDSCFAICQGGWSVNGVEGSTLCFPCVPGKYADVPGLLDCKVGLCLI